MTGIPTGGVRGALGAFFFLSGAVGLCYEVVWARQLSLLFGISVHAVSAVLVAFMGGLGTGAFLAGRFLDRGGAPVRLYAALEAGIGFYLFLFPWLYGQVEPLYVLLHPLTGGSPGVVLALRFALAVGLLIVPTILMGGTLPALTRYFSRPGGDVGVAAGWLYALNTLGAMTGALAAGYYLIEAVGLSGASMIGAVVNMALGGAAWALAAEPSWRSGEELPVGGAEMPEGRGEGRPDRLLMALFGVAGFCALALETLWTRMLTITLNNTTYAFTLILALFLGGIALGGGVGAWWLGRRGARRIDHLFGQVQSLLGLFAALSVAGFYFFPLLLAAPGGGVGPLSPSYLYVSLWLLPAILMMGGCFPLAVEAMRARAGTAGGAVGRLYAVNTVGCVVGSVAGGYLLIPWLGVEGGTLVIAWIALIAGGGLLMARKGSPIAPIAAFLVLTVLSLHALWGEEPLAQRLTVAKLDRGSRTLFFREGPSATVLVSRTPSDLSAGRKPVERLWINGDPIAGAFREALTLERLLAHIPLLLAPGAQNGLVICFGTGSTAGAALSHGLESLTAVDVSPEVFAAAPLFAASNRNVMNDPRLKRVVEDGRNYLLTGGEAFDFISVEPPPPSNAGVVSLYTEEFYRLALKRLSAKGVFSQWIPLHHLGASDFTRLVASFQAVFPRGSVWFTKWDAILVGARDVLPVDLGRMAAEMMKGAVRESLADIGYTDPVQLVASYMMGPEALAAYVSGAAPFHDDSPTVEFTSPRILAQGIALKAENLTRLLPFRHLPAVTANDAQTLQAVEKMHSSQERYLQGHIMESEGNHTKAAALYHDALARNPDNVDARYAYLQLNLQALYGALGKGHVNVGRQLLRQTRQLDRDALFSAQLAFLDGMFAAEAFDFEAAEAAFIEAIDRDDRYPLALLNLAGLYAGSLGEPEKARGLYERTLTLDLTEEERDGTAAAIAYLGQKAAGVAADVGLAGTP